MRGVNLAIVTFAFAVAMQEFMFKNPTINGGLNGSPVQGARTDRSAEDGGDLAWGRRQPVVRRVLSRRRRRVCYAIANLRRSATGRKFLATRSNERAAAAAGVNVSATKLLAFGTAAFVAGIAGALSSYRFGTVNPEYFGGLQSLTFFAFAYLGGISGVSGAIAAGFLVPGGVMFTMLDSVFGVPGEFAPILGGLGLIFTAILNPEGIAGGFRVSTNRCGPERRDARRTNRRRSRHRALAERGGRAMTLLTTTDMSVTFGGLRAVDGVDLEVRPGQLVGLIGPNGAGKTTFIDGITGFVPTGGRIDFDGDDISSTPAHQRARLRPRPHVAVAGAVRRPDVRENLAGRRRTPVVEGLPARLRAADPPTRPRRRSTSPSTCSTSRDLADRMPSEISQGQRKLVSAARALAAQPTLVCMDEPAAGLDTEESQELGARLRRIIDAGMTIFLVDHDMGLVLNICDYIYVIEFGRKIAEGTPAQVKRDPA